MYTAALPVAAPLRRRYSDLRCMCPIGQDIWGAFHSKTGRDRSRHLRLWLVERRDRFWFWRPVVNLQRGPDKTEFMWLTTARSQHRLPTSVSPSAAVRDLGVFIDQDLTMKTHVQRTASRCFATLCLSRLDYCDSFLINLPLIHIQRLQSVQNDATRLIFNLRRCDHITDALISLHWFRVPERITFNVAMLHCTALHHHTWRRHSHESPTCCTDADSGPPPRSWRSCFFFCWRKDMERPAKRCDISFVAGGFQEQAQDVLVPPLLWNCLTKWHFLFPVILSPAEQWSLQ